MEVYLHEEYIYLNLKEKTIRIENFKQWTSVSHPEVTGHFQRRYNSRLPNVQRMPIPEEDG